jgi:hypothetical protein
MEGKTGGRQEPDSNKDTYSKNAIEDASPLKSEHLCVNDNIYSLFSQEFKI